ncbi:hypothetical protein COBT_004045, partial [Conglomerata obtusa]
PHNMATPDSEHQQSKNTHYSADEISILSSLNLNKELENNFELQNYNKKLKNLPDMIEINLIEKNETSTRPANVQYCIKTFGGKDDECVEDFLRQFKYYSRVYSIYDETNLQFIAAGYLTGEAGRFFDNLEKEPTNWRQFEQKMIERYSKNEKLDKATRLRKFLNKTQGKNETTKEFVNKMVCLGTSAGLDMEIIIPTILSNMNNKFKVMYKMHMK